MGRANRLAFEKQPLSRTLLARQLLPCPTPKRSRISLFVAAVLAAAAFLLLRGLA